MSSYRYLDWKTLNRLNKKAIAKGRNRAIDEAVAARLPRGLRFPVGPNTMLHNGVEIRVQVILNARGDCAFLDMSFEEFGALPSSDTVKP